MKSINRDFYKKSYKDIDKVNMNNDDELKKYVGENLGTINVFRGYGAKDKQDFSQRVREDERFKREVIEGNNKALDNLNDRVEDATGMNLNDLEEVSPIKVKKIEKIKDFAGGANSDVVDEDVYDEEDVDDNNEIKIETEHGEEIITYDEISSASTYYEW